MTETFLTESFGNPESANRVEGRTRLGHRIITVETGIGYRVHG
jgi:hypothetical protein